MSVQIQKIDMKAADERGALHYFSTDRTGEFLLIYRNAGTKEENIIEINAPVRVNIPANYWHELIAITDIVFLELNSLQDGSEDTYRL